MINLGRHKTHQPSGGIALIETVVIIAVTTVITGIAIAGIAASFQYNQQNKAHKDGQAILFRIANTLRADVHRAETCHWDSEGETLRLELPGRQSIEYRALEDRWVRKERTPDSQPVTTALGIGNDYRILCDVERAERGELFSLLVTNQDERDPDHSPRMHRELKCDVVAVVGKDYLLLHD